MAERDSINDILLTTAGWGARLFRQNTGLGWAGKVRRKRGSADIVIEDARPLHAGLCVGSSDIIGGVPVVVTEEMVGKTVLVFTAIEVKTKNVSTTTEQRAFLAAISDAGGFAIRAAASAYLDAATMGLERLRDAVQRLTGKRPN